MNIWCRVVSCVDLAIRLDIPASVGRGILFDVVARVAVCIAADVRLRIGPDIHLIQIPRIPSIGDRHGLVRARTQRAKRAKQSNNRRRPAPISAYINSSISCSPYKMAHDFLTILRRPKRAIPIRSAQNPPGAKVSYGPALQPHPDSPAAIVLAPSRPISGVAPESA